MAIAKTSYRSKALPPCPKITIEPYSRSESVPHILLCIEQFCSKHCGANCFGCYRCEIDNATWFDYISAFNNLHIAFGYLPKKDQDNLFVEANFGCPACAISDAMQAFPLIARYSSVEPVGCSAIGFEPNSGEYIDSLPCFPISFNEACTDFNALKSLNIENLPPLSPPDLRKTKSVISTAQAIIKYLYIAKKDSTGDIPLQNTYKEDKTFTGVMQTSTTTSQATAQATGGTANVVNDNRPIIAPVITAKPKAVIEKGAVKVEASPTINVPPPDLAGMRAQDVELERIRQEGETKRLESTLETLTSIIKQPTPPAATTATDVGKTNTESEEGQKENNAVIPPIGGWTTRVKVATVLNKRPETLRRWEKDGYAPDGIPWPKGEQQGNMVFYRLEEVWPSIVKMIPNIDRERQRQLLAEIMEMRSLEEDDL